MRLLIIVPVLLLVSIGVIHSQLQALIQATIPTDQNHGCIHFSPYVQEFNPDFGFHPPASLIDRLLDTLRDQTKFRCVITYGVLNGLQHIVPAARDRGFRVIIVPWLDSDTNVNEQSLNSAISLVRQYNQTILGVACGSEVRLRLGKEAAEVILRNCATKLKNANLSKPIGMIDTWNMLCDGDSFICRKWDFIEREFDWIGTNNFAYWFSVFNPCGTCISLEQSADFHVQQLLLVQGRYPNRTVIMTEYGHPGLESVPMNTYSNATCTNGPTSEQAQNQVLSQTWTRLKNERLPGILFAAFREPWKTRNEARIASSWGICASSPPFACKTILPGQRS